jgi:DNA-binding NarL/FixJ family response regulator
MKILLVDDHTLVRRGMAELLKASLPGVEISEAEGADRAVEILDGAAQDVALVDIRMPLRDGIELLREVRLRWPAMPVIMLTGYDNGEYVKTALSEGAAGYLLKDATPEDLAQAIHVALSGSGNVLSPRAIKNLFEETNGSNGSSHKHNMPDAGLTKRENDVLQLLSGGFSNREISRRLFLSEKTIKAHLAAVFRKLGVTNRTQAAMAAVAMGIGVPLGMGERLTANGSGH